MEDLGINIWMLQFSTDMIQSKEINMSPAVAKLVTAMQCVCGCVSSSPLKKVNRKRFRLKLDKI